MSFLPENYETPNISNGYTKFTPGQTKLRILTSPILGWEHWEDGGKGRKVTRYKFNDEHPAKAKHFWAMIVWNYTEETIQIMSISQVSIQRQLEGLYRNEDWGAPTKYDITITRVGETQYDTKYTIVPSPGKPVSDEIKQAYVQAGIDLNKWMKGENPFKDAPEKEATMEDFPDRETIESEKAEAKKANKKAKKTVEETEERGENDPVMPWE